MMPPQLSWRTGLLVIAVFWILAGLDGYPAPFIDDAWHIGAAINLAQHGVFSNPLCEILVKVGAADHFYSNMPLHSYVLAGWLKLFGISTLSFQVLYTLLACLCSLLIYRLFPVRNYSSGVALVICLAVFGLLGGAGLRADALGLFFFLLGFDAWRARTTGAFFWKNLFLGLTVITFPNLALLALLSSAAALLHLKLIEGRGWKELAPLAVVTAAAYLISFGILLACIQGHFFAFIDSLRQNQAWSAGGVRYRFRLFSALGLTKWVAVQLTFLILMAALIFRWIKKPTKREELFFAMLILLGFGSLMYSSFNSAAGAHVWAFGCLVTALYLLVHEKMDYRAWLLYGVVFVVAAIGHAHVAIQHVLADAPPGRERLLALRAEVSRLQPARLYVDAHAMREIFDYRLPPNALCFETRITMAAPRPFNEFVLPANSVAIVSVESAFPTRRTPVLDQEPKALKIWGHAVPGIIQNPYDLVIMDNRD